MVQDAINVDDVYPSRFLRGVDIADDGWLITISNVYQEELNDFDGKPKTKIILGVSELEEEIALNRTQARSLSEFFGPNAVDWVGRSVAVSKEKLTNGQTTINFSRGKPKSPKQALPEEPPPIPVEDLVPPITG